MTAVVLSGLAGMATATHAVAAGTASISGTVRAAGSGVPLSGLKVDLYKLVTRELDPPFGNGKPFKAPGWVGAVQTAADGTYAFTGLAPSDATGYWVCFGTFLYPGNYQSACYVNQLGYDPLPDPLGFNQIPSDSTTVHVAAGHHVAGIDANLVDLDVLNATNSGTITGRVSQAGVGLALSGVRVSVLDAANDVVGEGLTSAKGVYEVDYVPASTGYRVCFDGSTAHGGLSAHAYSSRCASAVAVSAGATTQNVNATLAATVA